MSNLWYAVQENSGDAWDYGSSDYNDALRMLRCLYLDVEDAQIAVIENDVCLYEIRAKDVFAGETTA